MIQIMLILIKLFCVLCMRHCHCGREHSYQDRNVSSLSTDPSLLDDQRTQTVPEKLPLPFCCVYVGELRLRGSSDFQLAIEHIIRMPRDPALSCNWSEGQTSLTPAHFVLIPSLPPPPGLSQGLTCRRALLLLDPLRLNICSDSNDSNSADTITWTISEDKTS